MKLYEISDAIEKILAECVDHETGEITDEAAQKLDELEVTLADKLVNIGLYLKGELAEADAVHQEVQKLSRRRDIHRRRAEWLRGLIQSRLDGKLKDPRIELSFRTSKRVEVVNELQIPPKFIRVKQEVDRAGIAEAFRNGEEVPGAIWAEHKNLQVK